jgi:hypothetical protein
MGESMQWVRLIRRRWDVVFTARQVSTALASLVILVVISGSAYAASRPSEATLHISVTVTSTVETGHPAQLISSQVAWSQTEGIVYDLRPDTKQSAAEAIVRTTRTIGQEQTRKSLDSPDKEDEAILESVTVVTQ